MALYVTTMKRLARGSKLHQVRLGHEAGPVVFASTNWMHAAAERDRLNAEAQHEAPVAPSTTGSTP